MTEAQLLGVLEVLVKQSRSRVAPSAALVAALQGRPEARAELAKLASPENVRAVATKLHSSAGSIFSPSSVGEAASLLMDGKRRAWLQEIGRLAAEGLSR